MDLMAKELAVLEVLLEKRSSRTQQLLREARDRQAQRSAVRAVMLLFCCCFSTGEAVEVWVASSDSSVGGKQRRKV